jgi:hypothetical protein
MTAALGTLVFLVTIWMLVVVGAAVLEESGAKIAAALRGTSMQRPKFASPPVRLRVRANVRRPMRASAEWRAAA